MNAVAKKILGAFLPDSYKPFTMFPYRFVGTPRSVNTAISSEGFPFAEHEGVRIYFPKDWSLQQVEWQFRIYLEDEGLTGKGRRTKSPHCYVTESHHPEAEDVIVDIGCSEGFFSRSFASIAKKIYLFEADPKWRDPLGETFRDCSDKVVFTEKFVGARTNEREARLEDILPSSNNDQYFMKMDVEGAEREILESSSKFLTSNKVKMSCCCYHRQDDARYLTKLLRGLGFATRYSEGWMLPYDSRTFPFFRRGVIYARNY